VYNSSYDSVTFSYLFFLVLTILGKFIASAMVIERFQNSFRSLHSRELRNHRLFDRCGIISAFILLDIDGSGQLSLAELTSFMKDVRPDILDDQIRETFARFNEKSDDAVIDVKEFVNGIEEISVTKLLLFTERIPRYAWNAWIKQIMIFVILVQLWLFTLYGTWSNTQFIDIAIGVLMLVHLAELVFKLFVYSPKKFWYFSTYNEECSDVEFANRIDAVLIVLACLGYVLSRLILTDYPALRFLYSLIGLRLFTVVSMFRTRVYFVARCLPPFASLFGVLVVIIGKNGHNFFYSRFHSCLCCCWRLSIPWQVRNSFRRRPAKWKLGHFAASNLGHLPSLDRKQLGSNSMYVSLFLALS
jgi:hypothetical protein